MPKENDSLLSYQRVDGYRVEVERPATPGLDGNGLKLVPRCLRGRRLVSIIGGAGSTTLVDDHGRSLSGLPFTLQEAEEYADRERERYPPGYRVKVISNRRSPT